MEFCKWRGDLGAQGRILFRHNGTLCSEKAVSFLQGTVAL
jgi:hypothetical protein